MSMTHETLRLSEYSMFAVILLLLLAALAVLH
jgi:hypothetical protein